ncbi:MAG TPA: hypothetical protein VMQ17_08105 [Candidatus Sulfotelmatobacter sp.]|nr:hypothetical protein [Candidatus Sulfotelmatobacter sp.]
MLTRTQLIDPAIPAWAAGNAQTDAFEIGRPSVFLTVPVTAYFFG